MAVAIEISTHAIRLCREDRRGLQTLDEFPLHESGDPLEALARAPLPNGLGPVRVVLHHSDLLLRLMLQPSMPADRLARVVQFELQDLKGDDPEAPYITWHVPALAGNGDLRILAMLTKPGLIRILDRALREKGARLDGLIHPGVALFRAWSLQARSEETVLLLDCGGTNFHVALVANGDLVFWRSYSPAADDLLAEIIKLRGLEPQDAQRLMGRLTPDMPDDLRDLVTRQVSAYSTHITNTLRFAKAQLQLSELKPTVAYITGAGARVPGLVAGLAKRLGHPVRLLNPFAGRLSPLDAAVLDTHSELPSAWTLALATASPEPLILDACEPRRRARRAYWHSSGLLRVTAGLVAALLVLTTTQALWNRSACRGLIASLVGENPGQVEESHDLVDHAESVNRRLSTIRAKTEECKRRILYLERTRLPGKVAVEFLGAISTLQDPVNVPVQLDSYRLTTTDTGVSLEIDGRSRNAGQRDASAVLTDFEARLQNLYRRDKLPLVTEIKKLRISRDDKTKDLVFKLVIPINALPE